jgi:alpha-glucosidase (family GH31 glycosyl hydrolase)
MFWQYIEEGIPMLKPLVYFDQEDTQTHYRNDEYFLVIKSWCVLFWNPMQ